MTCCWSFSSQKPASSDLHLMRHRHSCLRPQQRRLLHNRPTASRSTESCSCSSKLKVTHLKFAQSITTVIHLLFSDVFPVPLLIHVVDHARVRRSVDLWWSKWNPIYNCAVSVWVYMMLVTHSRCGRGIELLLLDVLDCFLSALERDTCRRFSAWCKSPKWRPLLPLYSWWMSCQPPQFAR